MLAPMASVREYGMRLVSWFRRPAAYAQLSSYLGATFTAEPLTDANIALAPAAPGVYLLYRSGRLIFIGMAANGRGIRQELESHRRGAYGACTQAATAFDYETTPYPVELRREYLRVHMARYGGRLPQCNEDTRRTLSTP